MSLTFATTDQYLHDNTLFAYASRIAMGLARLRARFLDSVPRQLVVWDGAQEHGSHASYGTGVDRVIWRKFGLPGEIIPPAPQSAETVVKVVSRRRRSPIQKKPAQREIRAMLFGDIKWFSHLTEAQIPVFTREVLGRFARVIDRHRRCVLDRNTWGDALKILTTDIETAARCAIELQEEMKSFNLVRHGLPEYLALRLGGHVGPISNARSGPKKDEFHRSPRDPRGSHRASNSRRCCVCDRGVRRPADNATKIGIHLRVRWPDCRA
jgi:hypothetical protein